MLHREVPFLRICVPFCCGIITSLIFDPGVFFFAISVIVILVLFLAARRYNNHFENYLFRIPVAMSLYLLGLMLSSYERKSLSELPPESSVLSCTVSDYPEEKPNSIMLTVRLHQRIKSLSRENIKGGMVLYISGDDPVNTFIPGDRLIIQCTPSEITNRGNPYEFNYKFYMENLGIKYYAFAQSSNIIEHIKPQRRKLAHSALVMRRKIIEMYRNRGISVERLPLVSALTLGEKSKLDRESKDNFIQAGVMHIMAVSGLHAIILSMFVMNLLFFLKRRLNPLRIIITILFLWSFAFVTGLTPSVLRATLMFTFLQAGNLLHRKVNGINSVLASAFVLMLIRPSVIFDAGFLLSYSAVIFIISFYRNVYLMLEPSNRVIDWIWQSVAVTIVAQAGTFPLTVMLFNRFPVWFILTNIIIVPLSSLAIILGCFIPVLYPLKILSGSIAFVLDQLTGLTAFLTEKAAQLPYAGITGIGTTVAGCILLSGVAFFFMDFISGKRKSMRTGLVFFLLWAIVSTITSIRTKTTNELIVYNINGPSTFGIRTGKKLNIYADSKIPGQEINRHRSAAGLKAEYHQLNSSNLLLEAGKTRILFCSKYFPESAGCTADIWILSGSSESQPARISSIPKKIIVTSGSKLHVPGNYDPDEIHFIRKSGAYIGRL